MSLVSTSMDLYFGKQIANGLDLRLGFPVFGYSRCAHFRSAVAERKKLTRNLMECVRNYTIKSDERLMQAGF